MTRTQDIVFGLADQALAWDALEGRPSAVSSVSVFLSEHGDDDIAELATSGSPALESSPNTTLTVAAGVSTSDPRALTVASASGIAAGRTYLLRSGYGWQEWCEVMSVTGTAVKTRLPLSGSYEIGASFVSTRITISLSNTWVADDENLDLRPSARSATAYRVRWVYTVDGKQYAHDSYFRLVRYSVEHGVTPVAMEAFAPHWNATLPTDHREDNGARLIEEGYRQLCIDLAALDMDDAGVMDPEVVTELVKRRTMVVLQEDRFYRGDIDRDRLDMARQDYSNRFHALVPDRVRTGNEAGATATGVINRPIWIR